MLPTNGGSYAVPFSGRTMFFPMPTPNAISIAFAPVVDVSVEDVGGCTIAGEVPNHSVSHGLIRGYNVFRHSGTMLSRPTEAQMFGGFVYFVDLHRLDFSQTRPLVDADRNDLVYADNPDGLPNTGDGVIVFTDGPQNPDGSPRRFGTRPSSGGYWYMLQPVLEGRLEDMEAPGVPLRSYLIDTNSNGILDAVDIDGDGVLEFYSPQADAGETGIGLMPASCPPCTGARPKRWLFGAINRLPADEGLVAAARADGHDVVLEWTTSLESARIASFAAYRLENGRRERVGDQLLLASGLEGATYSQRDVGALAPRRRQERRVVAYELNVLGPDGHVVERLTPIPVQAPPPPLRRPSR